MKGSRSCSICGKRTIVDHDGKMTFIRFKHPKGEVIVCYKCIRKIVAKEVFKVPDEKDKEVNDEQPVIEEFVRTGKVYAPEEEGD